MESGINKTPKFAQWIRIAISALFCAYIIISAWNNREIFLENIGNFRKERQEVGDAIENYSVQLRESVAGKYDYINLNGFFVRMAGQITSNNVVLLKNGMETVPIKKQDMSEPAVSISRLSSYLGNIDIPFIFVVAPEKVDTGKRLLPDGVDDFGNDNADQLLHLLENSDVLTFDLRPYISAAPDLVAKYYPYTDHHWTSLGAFTGFQEVMNYLEEIIPAINLDRELLNLEQWTIHVKEKWSLGSRGKRVGVYFGGVDDMIWITPNFETNMSCSFAGGQEVREGTFETVNIRSKYYEREKPNYFGNNTYCLYIGGDYELAQYENAGAASDTRVLLLKDSYALPFQAFMSTEFRNMDVLDLRYFKSESLVEYIERNKPDVVIQMIYPGSFSNESQFEYGI